MLSLSLDHKVGESLRVLCLGAHCDDIEIGCGGTILKLIARHKLIEFHWVVFCSTPQRAEEASESAHSFLDDVSLKNIVIKSYRDGFLPFEGVGIKELFEELKGQCSPDLIFTHYRDDRHQDHRLISDLTWNTFRSHLILEYEIPKYDGDFGCPNLFIHLDNRVCRQKVEYILESFESQKYRHWFTEDTFLSVLRLRGIESCAPERYAEAFYCRKMVLF